MRPILVEIPSKLLFGLALLLAAALFVRDLWRKRARGGRLGTTPILLVAGALAVVKFRSPTASFIPGISTFSEAWLPIPIYAYGVMLGSSMVLGWFLAMRFAKQDGIPTDHAGALYMWTAVWSIIGARLLYVITNPSAFVADPIEIVRLNNGGLVAYGGMIGGFLASWYGCRRRGIPLLQWADVAAPPVVIGTAVTRVGCLLYGCDYGARSSLPWSISFPKGSPAWHRHVSNYGLSPDALWSLPVHPTQVYEAIVGVSLFALLLVLRRVRRFSGQVFLGWVIGYGLLRPLIEVVRDDDQRGNVGPFSTSQFIGIVSVSLGILLLLHLVRRYRQDPDALQLWRRPVLAGAGAGAASEAVLSEGRGEARASRRRKKRR